MADTKWEPLHLIRIYKLARAGHKHAHIARALGVDSRTLLRWLEDRPEVEKAIEMGRADAGGDGASFMDYVYQNLSPELRPLWDELQAIDQDGNHVDRVERLFENQGVRVRQQLFLHAFVSSNFNPSEAMRRCNLSKVTLDSWISKDPDFSALVEEMKFHKKNFCETALYDLIRGGDSAATIFANRTLNRDRGFADKSTIDVNVSGSVNVNVIDVTQLGLPVEVMRTVLDAVREGQRAGRIAAPLTGGLLPELPIDVESLPVSKGVDANG
jgi:hypothetical protein